ncbi:MAG TPA: tetratricopeptide repeat protein [Verrucomicrobiae bacterium]|nr:tetratricopeptide repeat protein [Verrucomicrobiae bacterium]
MRGAILIVLAIATLHGADEERLALVRKAKAAYDLAILSPQPGLAETSSCIQLQASLLPVATHEELPVIHYRRGYCLLISAAIARNAAGFRDAAAAFDQSTSTWPNRVKPVKGVAPQPGPSVLMVLSAISRLEAAAIDKPDDSASSGNLALQEDMSVGLGRSTCSPELMTVAACQDVFRSGREWLGWMALQRGDVKAAASDLLDLQSSFWSHWVDGKLAMSEGSYSDAAVRYAGAVEQWRANQARWRANWMTRLGPEPPMGVVLTDLGGAQFLAGQPEQAIATLDSAVAADPHYAPAYYLRARAKEQSGRLDAAMADYNLAARTAYASAEGLVSPEAHLYRGILLYRRKDFQRAEDEFANALNADSPSAMRADAVAWRHMAAVAGGACGASRQLLANSLHEVSPYFPKAEATTLIAACPGATDAQLRAR